MASSRRSLHRRLAALTDAARRGIRRREALRDNARGWAVISEALDEAGIARIDPELPGQGAAATAAAELAKLGESLELQRADAAFIAQDKQLNRYDSWAARVADRIPQFVDQPPPQQGGRVTLSDWYAWALARHLSSSSEKRIGSSARRSSR
jgi:hypothetical protein